MSTAAIRARVAVNPFVGLRPFEQSDSDLFFGREAQIDDLVARLARNRFVAVLGASGSGKSSLVKAGLLPALSEGYLAEAGSHWRVAVFRPGESPAAQMAKALYAVLPKSGIGDPQFQEAMLLATLDRGSHGLLDAVDEARLESNQNLLVVVDQFEELFRYPAASWKDRDLRGGFVKLLLESIRQSTRSIRVVITMRSDFLGECAQFRGLAEAINDGLYLIPRMTRDQLREAVSSPAVISGAELAPDLIQRVLNDVGEDPDQLPLLQHALLRTWDYWLRQGEPRTPLDVSHYERIGAMAHALDRHANEILDGLGEIEKPVARRMFQFITERGQDNREIRRPARFAEIVQAAGTTSAVLTGVIERFRSPGAAFLMPPHGKALTPESIIDISHESLIRRWSTLRAWVDADADSRDKYRQLENAARSNFRIRDPQVGIFLGWWKTSQPTWAWARTGEASFSKVKGFLDDCAVEAEAAGRAEADAQRSRTKRRRTEAALLVVALFLFLAVPLTIDAISGRVRAGALVAAQLNSGIEASSLLAIWAARIQVFEGRNEETELLLRRNAALLPSKTEVLKERRPGQPKLKALAGNPGARLAALGYQDGSILVNGSLIANKPMKLAGPIQSVFLSADGGVLAAFDLQQHAGAWRTASGEQLRQWQRTDGYSAMAVSPDGGIVALGRTDGVVTLARLSGGTPDSDVGGFAGKITVLQFHPDGKTLCIATLNNEVALLNIASGRTLWKYTHQPPLQFNSASFDPVQPYLAVAGSALNDPPDSGQVVLLSTGPARQVGTRFHGKGAFLTAFSPGAKYLATAGGDNAVRVWNGLYSQMVAEFSSQSVISGLAFSGDEEYLAVASMDNTTRLFHVASGLEVARVAAQSDIYGVFFESAGGANPLVFQIASDDGRLVRASVNRPVAPSGAMLAAWVSAQEPITNQRSDFEVIKSDDGVTAKVTSLPGHRTISLTPALPEKAHWILWWSMDRNKKRIAIEFSDNIARIYDLENGKMVNSVPTDASDGFLEDDGTLHTRVFVVQEADQYDLGNRNRKPYQKLYRRYPAKISDVVQQTCASLSRDLTGEEWDASFGWIPQFKTCPNLRPSAVR